MSNKILNTYAAYAFDDLIRKQSSSGAIFSLIAEKILSLSGIVYGICRFVYNGFTRVLK